MNQSLRPEQQLKLKTDEAVNVVAKAVASMKLDPLSSLKSNVKAANESLAKADEGVAEMTTDLTFLKPNEVPSPRDIAKLHQHDTSSLVTGSVSVPSHLPPVILQWKWLGLTNLDSLIRETLESMPKDLAMKRVQHGVLPAVVSSNNALKLQGAANAGPNQYINPTLYMTPSLPKLPPRPKYEHPLQRHQDSAYMCKEM